MKAVGLVREISKRHRLCRFRFHSFCVSVHFILDFDEARGVRFVTDNGKVTMATRLVCLLGRFLV